jgi:AcrR family transcriptional regulator
MSDVKSGNSSAENGRPVRAGEPGVVRRARILDAMVSVVYEEGFAGASVTSVCARAKVSRRTFYETFDDLEECFLAVLDDGYHQARAVVTHALVQANGPRLDGVRSALAALLSLFDSQPQLARVWLLESLSAGPWALECRARNVAAMKRLILEHLRPPAGWEPHPLASAGVMASVLEIVQNHMLSAQKEPLMTLLGPLMGLAAGPYLDPDALATEIGRAEEYAQSLLAEPSPERSSGAGVCLPGLLSNPRAHRARRCLLYLAEHPGASNRQVATAIGVASHTHISTLLARLAGIGLLAKQAGRPGHPNEWSLTPHGREVAREVERSQCSARPFTVNVRTSHASKRHAIEK